MSTTTLRVNVQMTGGGPAIGQQETGHVVPLDRPVETGGEGLGFNGGHLLLLGWGACFKSNLIAAAEARDIPVRSLRLDIEGETATSPARFSEVRMNVRLDADVDDDMKTRLITIAKKSCISSNTLERGTHVIVRSA